jgi:hypothetical protein
VIRLPYFSLALMLAVAACGGRDPVDDKANTTVGLPDVNAAAPSTSGEPHVATRPATAAPSTAGTARIPAALQGRWGLNPADCTTSLGDAKGLLVVNDNELRFYESRAVPAGEVNGDSNSISGDFAFTGEGQRWTKYEALKVDKGVLTRTETKPSASFSYAKCT